MDVYSYKYGNNRLRHFPFDDHDDYDDDDNGDGDGDGDGDDGHDGNACDVKSSIVRNSIVMVTTDMRRMAIFLK